MKYFSLVLLFFLPIAAQMSVYSQGFRGLSPIQSSCTDVENILKIKACDSSKVSYVTENENVEIYLLRETCQKLFQTRWNVQRGIVIAIIIEYRKSIPINEFPINVEKFERSYSDVEIFFTNSDRSIEVSVMSGNVVSLRLMPSRHNRAIFCQDSICDDY